MKKDMQTTILVGSVIGVVIIISAMFLLPHGPEKFEIKKNYFSNGQLEFECPYNMKGERDGLCKTFYPSGQMRLSENFDNGIFDGPRKTYFQDGKLETETIYKAGKIDERWLKEYYDNGRLKTYVIFQQGRAVERTVKEYFESGQLRSESSVNGQSGIATAKEYYEDGKLKSQRNTKNGVLIGAASEYDEAGFLKNAAVPVLK